MYKEINISLLPEQSLDDVYIKRAVAKKISVVQNDITLIRKIKRSIDARQRVVKINLRLAVWVNESPEVLTNCLKEYKDVKDARKIIIVGAGPAGLFAALKLIEKGLKPVIFERGKSVEDRKKDLKELYSTGKVNPNSNFGFGEGGAGTFSDGKLYTRSKKKGNIKEVLELLYNHGAQEDILWDSHPHIGTDILPKVIVNIRKTILSYGGDIHFNTKVVDYLLSSGVIKGVVLDSGEKIYSDSVILATGHSARDVYRKFNERGIILEAKNFAVGVRLEHPQHLIDCIQYHTKEGKGKYLPPAEYSFVGQFENRGVYSFCMCPGGVVVPASTDKYQQVVNGMSSSGRNTKWANSAMVVEVKQKDLNGVVEKDVLAGMYFQEYLEKLADERGRGNLYAPAQRMCDFVEGIKSTNLPVSSYKPGLTSSDMHNWLPKFIVSALQQAFRYFGSKAKGFLTNDALLIGLETRTSSPIRIPRDKESLQHIEVKGLYPCGEGSGYAGGIVSAAMDGINCANKIAFMLE